MKMKWFEKKVDERQERDIMLVEHIGFWAMYFMLVAAIIVQVFFMEEGAKNTAGEFVVFFITSVIVLVGWMRKGVWSYQSRKVPGVKAWLRYSLITMLIGIPLGIFNGYKWNMGWKNTLLCIGIMMLGLFICTFAIFCIIGSATKKREEELASQAYGEEDDEC